MMLALGMPGLTEWLIIAAVLLVPIAVIGLLIWIVVVLTRRRANGFEVKLAGPTPAAEKRENDHG